MNQTAIPKVNEEILEAALKLVATWDFTLAKTKLMETHNWTQEEVDKAEMDYKRYLALTKACPDFTIVPCLNIDIFWHDHILDTYRYAQDCKELFRGFLHHYPFFGMRGD